MAREKAGLSQVQLAERIGVAQQTVNSLEHSGKADRTKHILDIARVLDVDPYWLQDGDLRDGLMIVPPSLPDPDAPFEISSALTNGTVIEMGQTEYVALTRYDCAVSAGDGSILDPGAEPLDFHFVQHEWLRSITRAKPDHLAILKVDGDSMVSTLFDGDWILIDRSQTRLGREGIYAMAVNDIAWIKRLSLNLADRLVRIISDNPAYPLQELPEEEIAVIGRALWVVGRRLG